jgi:hypothetical protein
VNYFLEIKDLSRGTDRSHNRLSIQSIMASVSTPKSVLTLSLYMHLHGQPISEIIDHEWKAKASPQTGAKFENVGFDVDPHNVPQTLQDLRGQLRSRHWDGVIVAWCTRGNPSRTELFEDLVEVCVDETRGGDSKTKLIFNTGPDNLVEPILRAFPQV